MRRKQTRRKIIVVIGLVLLLLSTSVLAVGIFNKLTHKSEEGITQKLQYATNNNDVKAKVLVKVNVDLEKRKLPEVNDARKIVALTFDDGPGYGSTQRILDVLDKYNAKATWFCLGSRVDSNPDMLKKISKAGHEIANHSYNHPNLVQLSLQEAVENVTSTSNAIQSVIGKSPTLLRPPYGSYNEAIENAVPMKIALWNVDSLDWKLKNGAGAYQQVMNTLVQNPVILFHDIYDSSADAVEQLVPRLASEGYTFVTYSEMLAFTGE